MPTQSLAPPGPTISGHVSTPSRHWHPPVYARARRSRTNRGDRCTRLLVACRPPRLRALRASPALRNLLHEVTEQPARARLSRRAAVCFAQQRVFQRIRESYRVHFGDRIPVLGTRHNLAMAPQFFPVPWPAFLSTGSLQTRIVPQKTDPDSYTPSLDRFAWQAGCQSRTPPLNCGKQCDRSCPSTLEGGVLRGWPDDGPADADWSSSRPWGAVFTLSAELYPHTLPGKFPSSGFWTGG
jgi:hypothetical protein